MQKVILWMFFMGISCSIQAQRVRLQWTPLDSVPALYHRAPRPILVLIEASWCGWCKALRKRTLAEKKTAAYINQHYYLTALDGESNEPIRWQDRTYPPRFFEQQHALAHHWQRGQPGYPTLVWLTAPDAEPAPLPGFVTPSELEPFLTYFVESGPQQESFESYLARRYPTGGNKKPR
jgi:thioredoxin-related protein